MTGAVEARQASAVRFGGFLAKTYLIMALGLAVTGVVATYVASDLDRLVNVATDPWLAWGLFIVQIVLVVILSARVDSMSTAAALLLFFVYAALLGVSLSVLVLVYAQQDISSVFWVAAGMFLLMSVLGLVSKRDWSGAGGVLTMLLLGWLVAWFFSLFLGGSGNVDWALTFFGIALFAGLTAWDTNRLKKMVEAHGDDLPGSYAVNGALALYLDFINLFLLLLRASSR